MPIELTKFERGEPFEGDAAATIASLQQRLARLQLSQIVHGRRAILLLEGWAGSGKKQALKAIAGAFDPTHVHVIDASGDELDRDRHWLAAFWSRLPSAGESSIFHGGWYRRLAEQRVLGSLEDKKWARGCDEVNEFEAQQRDHGTMIAKLFFHVTAEQQAIGLQRSQEDPWLRHLKDQQPIIGLGMRERAVDVWQDMFRQTDTRWAPWKIIDDNDPVAGTISALTLVADQMERTMPAEPPAMDETIVQFRPTRSPEQTRA